MESVASAETVARSPASVARVEPERIRHDWEQLALAAHNVFATPQWADSWWEAFGAGRERIVLVVRDGSGEVVGVVPLYRERWGPIQVLRFIGDGTADDLGPICQPQHRDLVADALLGFLSHGVSWDLLIGRTMRADAGWSRRLGGRVLNHESSPVVDIGSRTWDEYLQSRSSHFRQRRRAAERRLEREHDVAFRHIDDAGKLEDATHHLFRLHRSLRNGRPSSFLRAAEFHRRFIPRAFEEGWLRLHLLELDGEPAGAVLEYAMGHVVHGYQMGIDRNRGRWFDVRLLVSLALRCAFDDGDLSELRIGRGGEEYKQQFADSDPGLETMVVGRGVPGRAIAASMFRARRLRPHARYAQAWLRSAFGAARP